MEKKSWVRTPNQCLGVDILPEGRERALLPLLKTSPRGGWTSKNPSWQIERRKGSAEKVEKFADLTDLGGEVSNEYSQT